MSNIDSIVSSLSVPRSRIEAVAKGPTVISVTSATAGDGKSVLAYGLAQSFASVGHNVLLVDANETAAGYCKVPPAPKLSAHGDYDICGYVVQMGPHQPSLISLASAGVRATCSKENVEASFERFRQDFAYIIVETPLLTESGNGLSFAACSDGVVVALKVGRGAVAADHDLIALLRTANVPILGVVTEATKSITAFDRQWALTGDSSRRILGAEETVRQGAARPLRSQ